MHIDARHLARRDNLVRHAEQEEARRILQHEILDLSREGKTLLCIHGVAHAGKQRVHLGIGVVTDILLAGRAQRLIQIPERIICAERDPVALRQVEVTLRLCLLGVLDAADRRLDAHLLELVLQSLINLGLAAPRIDRQLEFLAVLRHIAVRILFRVACSRQFLGSLREIRVLAQRLLIGRAEMRREERARDCRTICLDLDEILIVDRVAEGAAQMRIRQHALEVHAEHIDTDARDLVDLVLVILEETAARTVAALDKIHIARLQRHRALVVVLDVLDGDRVQPRRPVPIIFVALQLDLLILLEPDDLIGSRQHGSLRRLREIRLRVDDDKGRLCQRRQQRAVRLARLDEEVLPVHLDFLDLRGLLRAWALLQRAFERCLDEFRCHRFAVLEFYVFTNVETPRRRTHGLPLVRELRGKLHLVRNRHKGLARADARHRPAVPFMRGIDGLTEPVQSGIQMLLRRTFLLRAAAREESHHQEHQPHEHIQFFHGFSPSFPQKLR